MSLLFLNAHEAETVTAYAARIFPGDESEPGAREAGVVDYLDRSLAGFMRDQQPVYREALRELDLYCESRHGLPFAELDEGRQDEVIGESEAVASGRSSDGPVPSMLGRLFALMREHTIQGMFCDPAYGGNRDAVGWKVIGFPGAHWGYTAEQMGRGYDARQIPVMRLADLRALSAKERKDG